MTENILPIRTDCFAKNGQHLLTCYIDEGFMGHCTVNKLNKLSCTSHKQFIYPVEYKTENKLIKTNLCVHCEKNLYNNLNSDVMLKQLKSKL